MGNYRWHLHCRSLVIQPCEIIYCAGSFKRVKPFYRFFNYEGLHIHAYFCAVKKYAAYIVYFLFWLIFFIVAKAIFLLYHFSLSHALTVKEVFNVFLYGLKMDASFTGYICIFPFLLMLIRSVVLRFRIAKIIRIYSVIILVLLSFLTIADLELYKAWGFRMDATPLQYFKTPKEMGATISSAPVFKLLLIFILLEFSFLFFYKKVVDQFFKAGQAKIYIFDIFLSAFLLALLFVPIRGGIQKIPLNQSDVYFSEKLFADHAALNLPWNIMFSILNKNDEKNPFDYFSNSCAASLVDSLYDTGTPRIPALLNVEKPNVAIIILESFTAKWVGCLGGVPGVTPNLDRIAADGLLFTNIYAAGDRSEKGQVAVVSGYPNQAIHSIIKTPEKTRQLPSLAKVLDSAGYHSSYTYGGELEFANIKSYLVNMKFDRLVDKYSFPLAQRTTSWGVHDQYVFNRYLEDNGNEPKPFFAVLFSLSSHEPYDVPIKKFTGNDETTLFKNSIYYTDSIIGDFINKAKAQAWWNNTLIIILADHGHPLPGNDPNDRPSKFHIPLIFSGGALKLKGTINTIGSQTDIAKTLLDQLKLPAQNFQWSKDLLDSSARQFAFYNFNNGFGFVTPGGTQTIDNVSKKVIFQDPHFDTAYTKFAKAYMQFSYQDFLQR
jgi:phosphoglycerol transferase MdoB-like AlkP superfamily enzyme